MSTSKCQAVLTSFMIVITFVFCVVAEQQSAPPSAILQPPAPQNPQDSNEKVLKIEKRSWNNLQSSWGKRRVLDDAIAMRLLNLNSGGNRETLNDLLDRNNNGHDLLIDDILDTNRYEVGPVEGTFGDDDDYYRQIGEKRAWKNMNGAWGKRVEKDWNKFRGRIILFFAFFL